MAAYVYLLTVEDILVAISDSLCPHARQVRASFRLREKLPSAHLAPEDGRQQALLLLLTAPHQDGVAAQSPARIVVRRQVQTSGVHLLFDDDGVVYVQAPATISLWGGGPEPAPLAQPATEIPLLLVLL